MAIDKNSKYYQSLLNKGYSDSQISQMYSAVEGGQSAKDAVANVKPANTQKTTNTSTTTNTTRANTNIAKPEYQGTGTVNTPTPSYQHQGEGNYVYNPTSGYYEKQSTPATSTSTSTSTPTTGTDKNAQARQLWDSKSYQEQQDLLNKNPGLKENVVKIGGTIKEDPNQGTVNTETPKGGDTNQGGWDYQDNSPERMQQIADNLERMYQTDPGLFANEQTFRDFFINGVNRTPEQEKFLMDYYRNRKVYNEYDGYTSEAVGGMYAYGKVPESYLNYVKNSNPQRYAEIMDAKDKEQDKIKNNSSYDSILEQNGFESTNNLEWQKKEGLFVDENNDKIDDRLYHEPTEEERQKVDRINEIDARMLEINNALKWAEEDLTKAYPGATKATIMALVNDRSQNLLREKDDLMVERTQLAGTVDYLQNERQQQDDAGYKTIANLQKNLGMYYDYSPEGMSELAQAQYAATNVTLDQAENGTDTQKQMALDSVLSDYFDKYGSIIQRSKSQVINDVMNYAKKNGVSLSQALEDNFLSQLRSKPLYSTLSNGGLSPNVSFEKVGDTGYVLTVNPDGTYSIETVGGNYGGTSNGQLYGFTDYTPITSQQLNNGIDKFMKEHPLSSDGGQCGSFVNDYLVSLGYSRLYDDPIDKKKAITNSDTAVKGAVAVLDSKNYPQYGHTAIVTDVKGDKVKLLESNWNDDEKVHERWVNKSEILGYFDPSKSATSTKDVLNNRFAGNPDWNQNGYFDSLVPYFNSVVKDGKIDLTDTKFKETLKDYGITSQEFNQMAQHYADSELIGEGGSQAARALEFAIKTYGYLYGDNKGETRDFDGDTWLGRQVGGLVKVSNVGKAKGEFESLMNRLTLKELFDAKSLGATFGAMSRDEWDVLRGAATDVKWGEANFKENLEDLIESLYTASLDGKAALPKNWEGSKAQQMVNDRIENGTALGNYSNVATTTKSNGKFNTNSFTTEQDDFDSEWGM